MRQNNVIFSRRNIHFYNLATFPSFLVLNKKSLGALRCDLRGQNEHQIQNQHKILYYKFQPATGVAIRISLVQSNVT